MFTTTRDASPLADRRSAAERTRSLLRLPVVTLTSAAASVCLVHPLWLLRQADGLVGVSAQYAMFLMLGFVTSLAVFAACLLWSPVIGAGPPVAVGSAAAVVGLLLAGDLSRAGSLLLVCLALGLAVGTLTAGGLVEVLRAPISRRRIGLACWLTPLLAAWPWTTWAATHDAVGRLPRIAVDVPTWVVAAGSVVLVAWSTFVLLTDTATGPIRRPSRSPDVRRPWIQLVVVASCVSALALGLTSDLVDVPVGWLRPFVVAGFGLLAIGLAAVALGWRSPAGQASYLGVVAPTLLGPAGLAFVVAFADGGSSRVGIGQPLVLLFVAVGAAGAGIHRPAGTLVAGPLLVAAGAAGCWVMPGDPWVMVIPAAPLLAGIVAAVVAGFVVAFESRSQPELVAFAFMVATLGGVAVTAAVFGWAFAGGTDRWLTAGRVSLGITFAVSVLVGTVNHIRLRQGRRSIPERGVRVTRETDVTIA